jgi:hypothetical protein
MAIDENTQWSHWENTRIDGAPRSTTASATTTTTSVGFGDDDASPRQLRWRIVIGFSDSRSYQWARQTSNRRIVSTK